MTPSDGTRPAAALWLKPAARALPPTRDAETAGDLAARGLTGLRLLHLNESPYPPSPRALAAIDRAGAALHRYPAVRGQPLAAALAARTGIPASRIVIGSGSGELILFACILTLLPGDQVVGPAPSFPAYAHAARLFGAATVRAKLDAGGAPDAQTLAAAITNRTRLVFTCTPNPPSGGMMDAAALAALAAAVPDTVLLVVDEAYHEFARRENAPDVLAVLAKRRGPWIVLRTFSKAYGLAGLRIGYALCGTDDVADAFRRAMVPYNVTNVGHDAALAALEDAAHLERTVELVAHERRRLGDGLTRLGLAPLPSVANFLSVRLPRPAAEVVEALRRRGILVRDWRDPDHLNEIRITIGTPDDTDAVLRAMAEILSPVGA